jgi:hypothetical protein
MARADPGVDGADDGGDGAHRLDGAVRVVDESGVGRVGDGVETVGRQGRHAVLGLGPALVPEVLRGGHHGERGLPQGREACACSNTSGTMEISSRPLRNARGVEPMASTDC